MRILKIMLITSILGGLLSAPALSCTSESESTVSESQIVTVQRGDLTIDIAAAGNLALSRTEDLAFEIAGTVEEVLVEEGDSVKEGEVLAKLDTSEWDKELTNLEMDLVQAEINLKNAELALAEDHIKKAISYKPEKPGYHYILGFIYSAKKQWDITIAEFEIAVAKEPENGEYLRGLSWAIYSSGDVTKGLVAFLEEASRLAPANANILTDLVVAYLSSVNIDKATEYAERAVRLNPTNAVAQDST
ncbi:hypothetical protein ES703_110976 [subsurface metagenome]